jgi:AcrR family transcriptional regulator
MRNTIVHLANDLFADHRVGTVTLDEIAATAGITTRQLQTYFTSTAAIQAAIVSCPEREGEPRCPHPS